jgi:hypothetical protein
VQSAAAIAVLAGFGLLLRRRLTAHIHDSTEEAPVLP